MLVGASIAYEDELVQSNSIYQHRTTRNSG